jgi:hypothetical protein
MKLLGLEKDETLRRALRTSPVQGVTPSWGRRLAPRYHSPDHPACVDHGSSPSPVSCGRWFLFGLVGSLAERPCDILAEGVQVPCECVYRWVELLTVLQSAQGALVDLGALGDVGQGKAEALALAAQ